MLDPKLLRTEPDRVKDSQRRRGASVTLVDEALAADEARRSAIAAFERTRAEQKELGKSVARAQGEEKQSLLNRTKELAQQVKELEAEAHAAGERFEALMFQFGNLVGESVPDGGEDDGVVLESVGTPRDFAAEGFVPRDHLELAEILGAIDTERGAKVSGSRFYYLTGQGASLEMGLIAYAHAKALAFGFTPMIVPALVKPSAMEGTGFLGQAADDVYYLEKDDLFLVGTSEVALAAYHSDEILEGATLPRMYAGFSPCFRREAGSYGRDTRGIFRVHWFDKWEMFVFCAPDEAAAMHEKMIGFEREVLADLELPYQMIDVAAGDLGLSAARKVDMYTWVPSQQRYRELMSCSNCTEFQGRRLGVRARYDGTLGPVATLNGTLVSMARTIIGILENHQNADGSVTLPTALRPFLGGLERLTPVAVAE